MMRDQFLNEEHAGKAWEDAMRDFPTRLMEFSHVLVEKTVQIPNKPTPVKILVRAEVDIVRDKTKSPMFPEDFVEVPCANPKRKLYELKDLKSNPFPLTLDQILELTMAKNIRDAKVFQSWVIGVSSIIHNFQSPTEVIFFSMLI